MTTEKVKDAGGHSLTVINFRGHRVPVFPLESLERLDTFEFRDDDVLISAYPKSGTHWVWEITRMLLAGKTELPVVEKDDLMIELDITNIASAPSPRILTTHLLYEQLPTLRSARCKVVYITRNPRDVALSFYHHHVKLKDHYHYEDGQWKDYFHLFVNGELDYGSWFDYTRDWERVFSCEPMPPFITLSYEDLKENPVAEVSRLSNFLVGQSHNGPAFIQRVCDACDFAKMRQRKGQMETASDGSTIMYRKGEVGDWRNHFTAEQIARMQEVYDLKMAGSSHVVRYTLDKERDKETWSENAIRENDASSCSSSSSSSPSSKTSSSATETNNNKL